MWPFQGTFQVEITAGAVARREGQAWKVNRRLVWLGPSQSKLELELAVWLGELDSAEGLLVMCPLQGRDWRVPGEWLALVGLRLGG